MKITSLQEVPIGELAAFQIGSAGNEEAGTGCTVILCPEGAVAGVDVRGGSPSTRETDALNPTSLRPNIHAVLLAGGSAFGLDAAAGVMRYLEERDIGRDVAVAKVPIVCGAILFDLKCGRSDIRPDLQMGYEACKNVGKPFLCGNYGAGTGATVGKSRGPEFAMKGGLGAACFRLGDLMVGAVMAVNCMGDVLDPESGALLAGMLDDTKTVLADTEAYLMTDYKSKTDLFSGNTIIGTVLTNAALTKAEANKVASLSHNGIARIIRPAHSMYDGDTMFVMSSGTADVRPDVVGILAVNAVEQAILRAVKNARTLHGFKASRDLSPRRGI
ncbi:P1 family peptidase [Papillibacter cinnamivorans]|uniref:L-aminopeptidase/D-esterase n=1 Tax=Papillibacter cinnamivorans DSM 12816 TaxID=1122930 RepID=A0A1W1ZJH7_9FIRM|nr:P1 family peptidase [Papillibacter cinnamivorans]SMC48544.1 L-aminopeptidase/D-esterase [Papillibacter cinnamivorans DSM 12816]